MLAALTTLSPKVVAQTACAVPAQASVTWGSACSAPQGAGSLNPGQTVTLQNAAAGYVGSYTRICGLNGVLTAIAAPCSAQSAWVRPAFNLSGDWTLNHVGQNKPVTLTVNSTGGCTSSHNFIGSAQVNRDGSITVAMPPQSGFANCTAPRPYMQNPTSCKLTSPGYGESVFTFTPGFEVSSVPAENDRGGGCR